MIQAKSEDCLKIMFEKIKNLFFYEKSASIDLVYSLVTNYSIKAKTIVELSLNKFFNRQYSSVTRAINGYYSPRNYKEAHEEARKNARNKIYNFLFESATERKRNIYPFAIDVTGNIKNILVNHLIEAIYIQAL